MTTQRKELTWPLLTALASALALPGAALAQTYTQTETIRAELSDANPVRDGMSDRYKSDTESKMTDNRNGASTANRELIDAGASCRTSFCGGD